jgi:hypothetical protein
MRKKYGGLGLGSLGSLTLPLLANGVGGCWWTGEIVVPSAGGPLWGGAGQVVAGWGHHGGGR